VPPQIYPACSKIANIQQQASFAGSIIEHQEKYKYVIVPLMMITPKKQKKKSGKGLPHAMTNDNAIDYVHPNELMDLLLDASHRVGNNAHNEMLLNFAKPVLL